MNSITSQFGNYPVHPPLKVVSVVTAVALCVIASRRLDGDIPHVGLTLGVVLISVGTFIGALIKARSIPRVASAQSPLLDLPDELLLKILADLQPKEFAPVCRRLNRFAHDSSFWHSPKISKKISPENLKLLIQKHGQHIRKLPLSNLILEWDEQTKTDFLRDLPLACPNFEALNLNKSGIKVEEAKALAANFSAFANMTSLNLGYNDFKIEGTRALTPKLGWLTGLTNLNLKGVYFEQGWLSSLSPGLQALTRLTCLNLRCNMLKASDIPTLVQSIEGMGQLVNLDIGWNDLGDEGALALTPHLPRFTALTNLDVRINHIGDEAIRGLEEAASKIAHLQTAQKETLF